MKVLWTSKALSDLHRLHDFLAASAPDVAARTIRSLMTASRKMAINPRIGEPLDEFLPREVRRILVRRYEIRYEVKDHVLYILRVWHTREYR